MCLSCFATRRFPIYRSRTFYNILCLSLCESNEYELYIDKCRPTIQAPDMYAHKNRRRFFAIIADCIISQQRKSLICIKNNDRLSFKPNLM